MELREPKGPQVKKDEDWWVDDDLHDDDSVGQIITELIPFANGLKYIGIWQAVKTVMNVVGIGILLSMSTITEMLVNLFRIWLLQHYTDNLTVAAYGMMYTFSGVMIHHFLMALLERGGLEISIGLGERDSKHIGRVFYQIIISQVGFGCLATIVFLLCEPILLLVKIDPSIASLTGAMMRVAIPTIWINSLSDVFITYCCSLGVEKPWGFVSVLLAPVNIALSYYFVTQLRLGGFGLVYATIGHAIVFLIVATYIMFSMTNSEYRRWVGFAALRIGFKKFLMDSMAFAATHFVSIIGFESMIFFVYRTNDLQQISAMITAFNITNIFFFTGEQIAVVLRTRLNILIGNEEKQAAKQFMKLFAVILSGLSILLGFALMLVAKELSLLFSKEPVVQKQIVDLLTIFAIVGWFELISDSLNIGLKTVGKIYLSLAFQLTFFAGTCLAGYLIVLVYQHNSKYMFLSMLLICLTIDVIIYIYLVYYDWELVQPDEEEALLAELEEQAMQKESKQSKGMKRRRKA